MFCIGLVVSICHTLIIPLHYRCQPTNSEARTVYDILHDHVVIVLMLPNMCRQRVRLFDYSPTNEYAHLIVAGIIPIANVLHTRSVAVLWHCTFPSFIVLPFADIMSMLEHVVGEINRVGQLLAARSRTGAGGATTLEVKMAEMTRGKIRLMPSLNPDSAQVLLDALPDSGFSQESKDFRIDLQRHALRTEMRLYW